MENNARHEERDWHTITASDVIAHLGSTVHGLTDAEAERRLAVYGPNALQAAQRISPWTILLEQFKNILIIILLIGTVLSAFLGHGTEAIAIAVIVLFAVALGFIQEYRAERAIQALQQMAAPTATAIRNEDTVTVPARELVPGDVILLHAGDIVPADGRLIDAINLQIEEAALTGESVPVEKDTAPRLNADIPIGDRRNMAYSGTTVTYGRGRAIVTATGTATEFGRIAQLLQTVESGKTPLQENLDRVGRALAYAALVLVVIIIALGLFRGQPFLEMLIFGIALAVAVVPEALPAVVTISLAIGVQRMVRRNALVRRLPAVETLGSTSVICTDKTGTLTKDEMTVSTIFVAGQIWEVTGAGYEPHGEFRHQGAPAEPSAAVTALLTGAVLASDAYITRSEEDDRWHLHGDPTEGALVAVAGKAGLHKEDLDNQHPRVAEIPFTSESKRMTTLHEFPKGAVAYAKGAPEVIVAACSRVVTEEGVVELDAARREAVLAATRAMANEALRVLAIAMKPDADLESAEVEMTLLGLVGMMDPPRPEARSAIRKSEEAGIKVVMITGDHQVTAEAIARDLGLLKAGRIVTGADVEAMSDADLTREVEGIDVYARVSPEHKLRVVSALQERGHIAAMTGDGVNDAPALKKADIGIAMGITGTDVTKEAAAMTLTDDNFASIVAAVEEGRGIFDNIKKYLMYLLSSNIGEIGLLTAASLAGLPLPLTAVQILYVNLATDGLPALALAVDPPAPNLMQRPPRDPRTGIFSRPVVTLMVVAGLWSTLVNVSLFLWALRTDEGLVHAMTLTFVSLVLIQFFKAYNFRSDRESILRAPFANKWLNIAILWELILLVLIVYLPVLQDPFGTATLPLTDWLIVIAAALTISPVLELTKWMLRRGWLGG
ncbi:MAG: cation-translocating P-type ATPase [Armatimonadota bacterium]